MISQYCFRYWLDKVATSDDSNQLWLRYIVPHGVVLLQWVNQRGMNYALDITAKDYVVMQKTFDNSYYIYIYMSFSNDFPYIHVFTEMLCVYKTFSDQFIITWAQWRLTSLANQLFVHTNDEVTTKFHIAAFIGWWPVHPTQKCEKR